MDETEVGRTGVRGTPEGLAPPCGIGRLHDLDPSVCGRREPPAVAVLAGQLGELGQVRLAE
jgi:hypothetical protein